MSDDYDSSGRKVKGKHRRQRGNLWYKQRQRVIARDTHCVICGQEVDKTIKYPDAWSATVDHIVPVSMGGTNEISNLALAHFKCNSGRGSKNIDDVRFMPKSRDWF